MTTKAKISKEETDRFTEVNGVKIHYNEAGTGPALFCFHGGGPGASAWGNSRHVLPQLSEHFRCILMDLPAYGESDKTMKLGDEPLDINWAKSVLGLMDQLDIDKAHLYVSSQSGAMAVRFGLEYPDRIGKIIFQSSGVGGGPLMFGASPSDGIKSLSQYANNPTRDNMKHMMELFIPNPELCTDEMIDGRFNSAQREGHLEARREFSASKNSDLSGLVKNLKAPVLIVWGHQDRMVPVEGAFKALAVFPNARLHIWGGGAGHFVAYEYPDEFSRLIIDFLTH